MCAQRYIKRACSSSSSSRTGESGLIEYAATFILQHGTPVVGITGFEILMRLSNFITAKLFV